MLKAEGPMARARAKDQKKKKKMGTKGYLRQLYFIDKNDNVNSSSDCQCTVSVLKIVVIQQVVTCV